MAKVDKEIPWDIIIPEVVKAFTPFIQGIAWYTFSKVDKKANALNNLIAIAEIIPAIDLGLPRGIVLAAMYDKTGDALDMINQLAQALTGLPAELKKYIKDLVDETKEDITETFIDPVTEASHDFQSAISDCKDNAKKRLIWPLSYGANIQTYIWIQSCMLQKGYNLGTDYIKDKFF